MNNNEKIAHKWSTAKYFGAWEKMFLMAVGIF